MARQALEDVVGRYSNGQIDAVSLDGDRPMLSIPGRLSSEIVPQGDDAFFVLEAGFERRFVRDPATGQVVSATGAGLTLPRIP